MRVAVIPGDGIGAEVMAEATKVLDRLTALSPELSAAPLALTSFDFGADRYLRDGVTLPEEALADFTANYAAILVGALGDPRVPDSRHARDILLGMRFKLDLFINLRPIRLLDPRLCPLKDRPERAIDIVCFRENTEGPYVGVGGNFKRGTPDEVAISEDVNTRKGVERIIRAAFEYARKRGRRRVCMSDKSNAIRHAHDLWQRVFAEVRAEYSEIEAEHRYIDVLAMEMVQAPERFDVIVTSNLFGDIITDLGAGIAGGLGLAASGNIHPGRVSMFEPVHGSAPNIAGKGLANPVGAILSLAMMLEHLGHDEASARLERAVATCLEAGRTTRDLGGELTTAQAGDAVCAALEQP